MLLVYLMHEFELGIWKILLIHLIRILNVVDKILVNELDRRYVNLTLNDHIFIYFMLTFFVQDSGRCLPSAGIPSDVSQIIFRN